MKWLFVSLLLTAATTLTQAQTRRPASYVDDLFHCDNPVAVSRDGIDCNEETWKWQVDQLEEDAPPRICGKDYEAASTDVADWEEPCVLWAMAYGNLVNPDVPFEEIQSQSERDELATRTVSLNPLFLTLVWPSGADIVEEAMNLNYNSEEMEAITELHLMETLQAESGQRNIERISLDLGFGDVKDGRFMTVLISGDVLFASADVVMESALVQNVAQTAFDSVALELYVLRLQIASDPALRSISAVVPGTDVAGVADSGAFAWTGAMTAIVVAVVAALLAVCVFSYCVFCRRGNNSSKSIKSKQKSQASSHYYHHNSREIPQLATNPTSPEREDEAPYYQNQEDEEVSLDPSMYSYINDEASTTNPVLYAINEANSSAENSESSDSKKKKKKPTPKQKGLVWSVKDTKENSGGGVLDLEAVEVAAPRSMLGPDPADMSMDDDRSFLSIGMDTVLGQKAFAPVQTPSGKQTRRNRFEKLWRNNTTDSSDDDDVENVNSVLTTPPPVTAIPASEEEIDGSLVKTVKKSNQTTSATTSVIQDEQPTTEPEPSPPANDVEAPAQTTTVEVETKTDMDQPKMVNRIPSEDEEDSGIALFLPAQLNASKQNESNCTKSLSSHGSQKRRTTRSHSPGNDSTRSSRSTGSTTSNQSSKSGKSKSGASIKSVSSAVSTDSAKYRSLLGQGDINDGALFLSTSLLSSSTGSASGIPAMMLNYDTDSEVDPLPARPIEVETSFDTNDDDSMTSSDEDVVSNEGDKKSDTKPPPAAVVKSTPEDSDDEDVYVDEQQATQQPTTVQSIISQEFEEHAKSKPKAAKSHPWSQSSGSEAGEKEMLATKILNAGQEVVQMDNTDDVSASESFEGVEKRLPFDSDTAQKITSAGEVIDEKKEDEEAIPESSRASF